MKSIKSLIYERAKKEYDSFLEELESLPGKEIIQHSYEKVVKEDFLLLLEEERDDWYDTDFLADIEYPLDFLYNEWLGEDSSWLPLLEDTIYYCSLESVTG